MLSPNPEAERIYKAFLFKLSRRSESSYWMTDIKDGNSTPKLIVEKHGELLSRWRVFVFETGEELVSGYTVRRNAIAMAEFKLANRLAATNHTKDSKSC